MEHIPSFIPCSFPSDCIWKLSWYQRWPDFSTREICWKWIFQQETTIANLLNVKMIIFCRHLKFSSFRWYRRFVTSSLRNKLGKTLSKSVKLILILNWRRYQHSTFGINTLDDWERFDVEGAFKSIRNPIHLNICPKRMHQPSNSQK